MSLRSCGMNLDCVRREMQARGTQEFPCEGYRMHCDQIPGNQIQWHWHDEIEVIFVQRGTLLLRASSRTERLNEGDFAVISASVLHAAEGSPQADGYSIVFHPALIGGKEESVFERRYIQPLLRCREFDCAVFRRNETMEKQMLRMFEMLREDTVGYEFVVREVLSQICLELCSRYFSRPATESLPANQDRKRIEEMMLFIQDHYAEDIRLCDIASAGRVGERECLRCFQRSLGQSPIQYLMSYRLLRAANLLRSEPEKGISEIAERCGFSSASYFSHQFRKFFHCTPKEYRKA